MDVRTETILPEPVAARPGRCVNRPRATGHCELLGAILDQAGHAVIASDPDGTLRYLNRYALELLGYEPDELIGRQTPLLFHDPREIEIAARRLGKRLGRAIAADFSLLAAALAVDGAQEHAWTYVCRDGRRLPVSLQLSPLYDENGRLRGYLGVAHEIERQRQVDRERAIAATAFESQAAIMVTDADQRILRVNPAFTRLTGYAAEEVIGRRPSLLKSGRHDAAFYARMWQSLNETGNWQGELWNRRKDGEIFPEWLTISAIYDGLGRLSHYVSTFSDISSLKAAESEIHQLAFYDPLTGLPNRRLLLDRLAQAQAAGIRSKRHGALLLLDLDNFKTLNDTLGHDVGDLLLIEVADRLRACLRPQDTAARQGGDEFAVLLGDLDPAEREAGIQAETVAEKIRAALGQPYLLAGKIECFHSASVGISLFAGQDKPLEALLKQADIALYKAKEAGRNAIRFFDSAMQTALEQRAATESGLRQALVRGEFVLHVQALVDAERQLIGAELLLRWQPAGRSLVPPGDFIPLAEETGLITPIGLWILDQACARLRRWADDPATAGLYLAVNVSAKQFRQPDFVDQVVAALERHDADPRRLKLELTESLLLDNVDDVVAKMKALRERGVRFSLDDFGTGYASLSYLKRFPFQQIKVDQAFVRDMLADPDDAAIVGAIISLGNSLRMGVVAEGVEDDAQHAALAAHGCKAFQGYLFGRPVGLDQFEAGLLHPPAPLH